MENHYLYIIKTTNGNIEINSADGVFSSYVTRTSETFADYCEEKANEWLTSKLGNYDRWSNKNRKEIAQKWRNAKTLSEGKYNYYFNLGSIEDIFHKEVASLAKSLGISNYTLTIH